MKDLEYYARIGKEIFELKGIELRQWVSDQIKIDRQYEAEEAEKVRKHDFIKFLLERDINDITSILDKYDSFFQKHSYKQLAKPNNAEPVNVAKHEDGQNTLYQTGNGHDRGKRGNYSFPGQRGRGNGNWRGNNTQQSGGRDTLRPQDGYECY